MAVVLQGFLGPFTGKVGGAVGGIWKGINYIKGYVIPANPNTAKQQAQRTKFSNVVSLAQQILATLISTFWNPFAVKMSGYNYFIQQFINSAGSTGLALVTSVFSKGSLEPTSYLGAERTVLGDTVNLSWDTTVGGNGLATDSAVALLIDKTSNKLIAYDDSSSARSEGTLQLQNPDSVVAANLIAYVFFYRGTGSSFMVSNSIGIQVDQA